MSAASLVNVSLVRSAAAGLSAFARPTKIPPPQWPLLSWSKEHRTAVKLPFATLTAPPSAALSVSSPPPELAFWKKAVSTHERGETAQSSAEQRVAVRLVGR